MIILDIETTGLSAYEHGICEIGAIQFENPANKFYMLCKIDNIDKIDPDALKINGQNHEKVRNIRRVSQKYAISKLFSWAHEKNDFYLGGQNVGIFDLNFINTKAKKYGLKSPFQHRCYELHSVASAKYDETYGNLPIKNGKSKFGLTEILDFVGMKDNRETHNALEDCKLEAEAISRIRYGKNLIQKYNKFSIPDYLKK